MLQRGRSSKRPACSTFPIDLMFASTLPTSSAVRWKCAPMTRKEAPMDTPEHAIDLAHVRIDRGGHMIIPDLSLSVPRGSVFGLVGPSGSGKTTVMRALLGLTPIVSGHGELLGTP